MKWNKIVGAMVFLLTAGCLVVSIIMTRQSGVASAATAEGKQLLGWASVIIHLGMPIFGIASGAFTSKGMKGIGKGCLLLVVLCAFFSITNVLNFVAAERTGLARAQARAEKAKDDRLKLASEAKQKHLDTVNDMAKTQLKWYHGTGKEADGRREKKDAAEGASKFILDYAKAEVPMPTMPDASSKDEITVTAEDGAKMVSDWTGWNVSALQLSNTLQTVLMLIVFEVFGWSIASYLWFLDTVAGTAAKVATALAVAPAMVGPSAKPKLLTGPKGGGTGGTGKGKAVTIRTEPSAAWRQLLDQVDFPPAGARHQGPLRPKDKRSHVALRFATWLQAYNEVGDYRTDQMDALYEEFHTADHRSPWGVGIVKSELEAFRKRIASKWQGNGTTMWTIQRVPPEKLAPLLEKAGLIAVQEAPADPLAHEPEVEEVEDSTRNVIMANFWPRRTSTLPN